jgi:folylpolyglutamate synthase/dihydropteroate synthase
VLAEMTGHLVEDPDKLVTMCDPGEALEHAIRVAHPEDAIFVTGSLYLVGDLRRYWNDRVATLAESERRLDPTKRRPI